MKKLVKRGLTVIIGVIAGATTGYFYWEFVGCNTGTCAITSNPYNSTIYGAVMGGLLFSMLLKSKSKATDI